MRPICSVLCLFLLPGLLAAQEQVSLSRSEFNISPQIGTDIGGAVPVPFGDDNRKINAFPRLTPSIGIAFDYNYQHRWGFGIELNYKRIVMDADARVSNQKFKGQDLIQYFSGTAEMNMAFTLLELPLYAKYIFGNNRQHKLIFGGYFAYNLKATFQSIAQKGFNGPLPDVVESTITAPMIMDFTPMLSSWDTGLLFGCQTRIYHRIHAGLRFLAGLKDIFVSDSDFFDYRMYPMRGAIVLHYDLIRLGGQQYYLRK